MQAGELKPGLEVWIVTPQYLVEKIILPKIGHGADTLVGKDLANYLSISPRNMFHTEQYALMGAMESCRAEARRAEARAKVLHATAETLAKALRK